MTKSIRASYNNSIKATGDSPSLFAEVVAPAPYF